MRLIPALAILSASLLYASQSHALVGLSAGVGSWQQNPSGDFKGGDDSDRLDIEDDLNIGADSSMFYWARFKHVVPVIPNLKFQHTPISLDGQGTAVYVFGGTPYAENVKSKLELNQTDFILFYSPLNNIVELDIGLNIKLLDGLAEVEGQTSGERESVTFSGPVPMLYGNVQFNLPMTGLYAGAEGSAVGYAGHSLVDLSARVGYRFGLGVGGVAVEGGYRSQRLKLDDFDGVDADLRIEGPWFGVAADF
ncbi:MAG: TIGR04219 family outer membrane beta-barrel protein [Aquisalimonadaceae bacterium]